MKLAKLIDPTFQRSLKVLMKQPLPLRTAFKLRGIVKVVDEELDKYEAVRKEALHKHGKKNEDGSLAVTNTNNVTFEPTGMQSFVKEIGELTSLEVDVPAVSIKELGDDLKLSAEDLMNLDGLLVD